MIMVLMLTTIVGVSSSHWSMVWVMLEINTLAMCYMISKDSSTEKQNQMSTINYYLIQVMSSAALLISMASESTLATEIVMIMALIMKMGGWPSHMWYMKLISSMKMSMKAFMVVMTWQKILPIFLMFSMNMSKTATNLILMLALMSSVVPVQKLSGQLSFKSTMALSSLNNNGWMMVAAMTSLMTFSIMLSLYSVSLMLTLSFFKKEEQKNKSTKMSPWSSTMVMGNMSGLPPMTMFWVKILVLQKALEANVPTEIMGVMIIMACVMLYYYLWLVISEIPKTPKKHQNVVKSEKESKMMNKILVTSILATSLVMVLGLT